MRNQSFWQWMIDEFALVLCLWPERFFCFLWEKIPQIWKNQLPAEEIPRQIPKRKETQV